MDALAEKLDARLREWKPETAAEARERITEVIELADHDILDIARSRAVEQEVFDLLDEPAAGLNRADREILATLLRELCRRGMTIVLVEHQMDLVSAVCDELTVLDFSSVLCEGPPSVVINDQRVLSAYIGVSGSL